MKALNYQYILAFIVLIQLMLCCLHILTGSSLDCTVNACTMIVFFCFFFFVGIVTGMFLIDGY